MGVKHRNHIEIEEHYTALTSLYCSENLHHVSFHKIPVINLPHACTKTSLTGHKGKSVYFKRSGRSFLLKQRKIRAKC